jgi:soluble lytic murein transglycosylase-like protein
MTLADLITQTAQSLGVDPQVALEVAIAESNLNPDIPDSPRGAIGIYQLLPGTAADMGVNPRITAQNILGGITYLGQQLARFGDVATAVAAYNWGPAAVAKALAAYGAGWLGHAPAETRNYVAEILGNLSSQYTRTVNMPAVADAAVQAVADNAANLSVTDYGGLALLAVAALGVYLLADGLDF